MTVFGKSGSGKSTSLNMIGALDIPSKGRVILDGKDISKLDESDLAQLRGKKIGFVFQTFNLIPSLLYKFPILSLYSKSSENLYFFIYAKF